MWGHAGRFAFGLVISIKYRPKTDGRNRGLFMRIIKSITLNILIGIVAAGLTISSQTQAALFGVNDSAIQAGLGIAAQDGNNITRDLANGLDWLDWTLTTNRSSIDVSADLNDPRNVLFGWRYALTQDFLNLAVSAGIPNFIFARLKDGPDANSTIPSICHWECRDKKRTAKN